MDSSVHKGLLVLVVVLVGVTTALAVSLIGVIGEADSAKRTEAFRHGAVAFMGAVSTTVLLLNAAGVLGGGD
ncbi:hypothetical protein ABZY31_12890 [Streptomyces sp. NPDC006529]|uniref:hypothetical protein n=1 Tax=Streptomyces sp. NPDC006529 TaxID=3157177 RepID=UPI0033B48011